MSRQDRHHHSPYSPRPSVENIAYSNKKSPGVAGGYSPMMRSECHLPSPESGQAARPGLYRSAGSAKVAETMHGTVAAPELPASWGMDRFNQMGSAPAPTSSIESLVWGASFAADPPLHATPPAHAHSWNALPPFDTGVRRPAEDISDPWTLGQFRVEPPHQVQNTFVEQNVSFDSLSGHLGHQPSLLPGYLDDSYTESSRVD
jgi:hypothetical protein